MPRDARRSRPARPKKRSTLEPYREKRDFSQTREPAPARPDARAGPLTFVIQKHDASRLHYDFRLEVDGVLKSWSVPKGPSLDPQEKHLAVMVEDHPIDYGSYEGVIPKGEYGAGQVIVWDNGTYSPDEEGLLFHDRQAAEERMRAEIEAGKISITMRGRKLKGSWTLVRMQRGDNEWLLIKHRDAAADDEQDVLERDRSVISGLSIDDLKAGRLPDRAHTELPVLTPADAPAAQPEKLPDKIAPMLATLTETAFADSAWIFEPKFDGVRAIAFVRDGSVKLLSRRGLDATAQYLSIADELAEQPAHELALDGEIVALDDEGRPSFELLQQRLNLTRESDIKRADAEIPVLFYAFDLLHVDGYDLRAAPLTQRRALLERVLAPSDRVRLLDHFGSEGEAAFEAVTAYGIEGVVAKRRDSVYETGRRARTWLKVKATTSDEFVVGGYSAGQGGRADTFGALLLGQYDDDGKLVFAGGVGSGFDDQTLAALRKRLGGTKRKRRPFAEELPIKGEFTWVKPELVVEVKFAQWTSDRHLRAPVFLRLRDDKPASSVVSVDVAPAPEPTVASVAELDDASAGDGEDVLDQLKSKRDQLRLEVGGHKIAVTNLDKPLWPGAGRKRALTKRDFLVYLARVAPYLLPHLRDRPLTLTRYPNGIEAGHFYQKHWESGLPEFVDTVGLFSSSNEGDQRYLICNNLPTLLWLGQLADLELHTWYSRVSPEPDGHDLPATFTGSKENIEASLLNYPDFIVFDLDPYIYSGKEGKGDEPELNRAAFRETCNVARWLKDLLDSLSLSSFVKTSGRTGLHVYVPILRRLDYTAVRAAAETVGRFLLRRHPTKITMEWSVEKRTGKVFFDHNQNMRGKTLASIYSARPLPGAPVSMPLHWDEVGKIYPPEFTILTVLKRLEEVGDLWSGILDVKHDIEGLLDAAAD